MTLDDLIKIYDDKYYVNFIFYWYSKDDYSDAEEDEEISHDGTIGEVSQHLDEYGYDADQIILQIIDINEFTRKIYIEYYLYTEVM